MLGFTVKGYTRNCGVVTGGVGYLWMGDAEDWVLTEGTPGSDGEKVGYSTLARRTGATAAGGAKLYLIDTIDDTKAVEFNQSNADGLSNAWDYLITGSLAQMSQALTNFNMRLDASAICGQPIFFWTNSDNKVFVVGEKYVNGSRIYPFKIRQDGSKMFSGKVIKDRNGQDLSLKGSYSRPPFEFTGGINVIEGFMS